MQNINNGRTNWLNSGDNTFHNWLTMKGTMSGVVLNEENVTKLSKFLCDSTVWDSIQFLFAEPSEFLFSLTMTPYNIPVRYSNDDPETPLTGYLQIANGLVSVTANTPEERRVSVMNINLDYYSQDNSNGYGGENWKNIIDMGTWDTSLFASRHNDYRDQDPYTQIDIFLPYVGIVRLPTLDFYMRGKKLCIKLGMDYWLSKGVYYICVDEVGQNNLADMRILATYEASFGYNIPLSSTNLIEMTRNLTLGIAKATATIVGTAVGSAMFGVPGGMIGGTTASSVVNVVETSERGINPDTGRLKKMNETTQTTTTTRQTSSQRKQPNFGMITATSISATQSVSALANAQLRPSSDRVNNSLLMNNASKCVKLVIRQVSTIDPNSNDYKKIYGRPYGQIDTLNNLSGFTQVHVARLENFNNTLNDELVMIDELLKSGIILP